MKNLKEILSYCNEIFSRNKEFTYNFFQTMYQIVFVVLLTKIVQSHK